MEKISGWTECIYAMCPAEQPRFFLGPNRVATNAEAPPISHASSTVWYPLINQPTCGVELVFGTSENMSLMIYQFVLEQRITRHREG